MRFRNKRTALVASVILVCPIRAWTQTDVTWIGQSGGSWHVASNWSGGTVPTLLSDVQIGSDASTVVVSTLWASFRNLDLSAGSTLSFPSKAGFDVNGPTIHNAGLMHFGPLGPGLYAQGIGLGGVVTLMGGGIISVERYTSVYGETSARLINLDNTIRGSLVTGISIDNHGTFIAAGGAMHLGTIHPNEVRNVGNMAADGGATLIFSSHVDNTGGLIEAMDEGVISMGPSITGGVLRTHGAGYINGSGTLTDLTLDGEFRIGMRTNFDRLFINNVQNSGTLSMTPRQGGSYASLQFGQNGVYDTRVLNGGGWITMSNTGHSRISNSGTLITDNTIYGNGIVSMLRLITSGQLIAPAGALLGLSAGFQNTGTILVETGGRLSISSGLSVNDSTGGAIRILEGGTLTISYLQSLAAGSIELDGTLKVAKGVIGLTDALGSGALVQTGGSIAARTLRIGNATITAGTTTINSGGGSLGTSRLASLTISGSGKLDLTDHDLILDYDSVSPIDPNDIRLMLASAYAGGAWTGPGLTSSSAGASQSPKTGLGYLDNLAGVFTTFSGQAVDDSSILVKYTLTGDANIDGSVDARDLYLLSLNWLGNGFWENGDFNYDGFINSADLSLLAFNWNGDLADALQSVGLEGVSIPEPGMAFLLCSLPLSLIRRRGISL